MRPFLWPLGLVVAFGLGLAAARLPWHGQFTTQEVEHLRAAESRLQMQVSILQARIRAREAPLARQQSLTTGYTAGSPGQQVRVGTPPVDRSPSAATLEGPARPSRPERGGGSQGESQGTAVPAPTVEAALERFYLWLDETNGSGGPGRWQRMQQLTDDLRRMGNAGTEALLRVLAGGTSSDERRAAAQLLGELQVPQALPLLQNILENDGDVLLRRAAASGLRRLQTPETIPVLDALIANPGEDRFVRMSAASGLAQLGKSQGIMGLEQIFEESTVDGRGREMAFRALTFLNDERALPFMRRLVTSDAEVSYRLQAIRFLSAQGDQQALPSLQLLMQSTTEQRSIRDAAAQAHAAITGK